MGYDKIVESLSSIVTTLEKKKLQKLESFGDSLIKLKTIKGFLIRINGNGNKLKLSVSENSIISQIEVLDQTLRKYEREQKIETAEHFQEETNQVFSLISIDLFSIIEVLSEKVQDTEKAKKEIEQVEDRIRTQLNNLNDLKVNYDAKLNGLFDTGKGRINDLISSKKDEITALENSINERNSEQIKFYQREIDKAKDNANEIVKNLKESEEKAKNYFQIFEYGGYLQRAKEERDIANNLRKVALALMIFIAAVTMIAFLMPFFVTTELDIPTLLSRYFLVLTLMIPAGYAARESGRHRTNAEMYTLLATEFASLNKYLTELPTSKDAIDTKLKLAEKYFGHFRLIGQHKTEIGTEEYKSLIKDLIDKLTSANEKKSG